MTTIFAFWRHTVLLSVAAFLAGCGGDDGTMPAAQNAAMPEARPTAVDMTLSDVGFMTPESVLHDPAADVYLVSNVNGAPLDKEGNGFISAVSPDGEVLELKWIDGATAGVTLNAPKGMAFSGDRLFVADIDCIRMFDRTTGAAIGEECVPGASFLNDVATARSGGVLFTDTGLDASFAPSGTDAVYRLDSRGVSTVVAEAGLGAPNGIIDTSDGPLVVTFMSGEIYRIDAAGNRTVLSGPSQQQLDGVVELADGRILTSSWGDSCIYELSAAGTMDCIIPDVEAPADIGADTGRNRVLIPLFNANAVRIKSIP
jgi:SMP-30/Gluconolactonase/LRE-like region